MLASLLVIVLEDCAHWWTQDLRIRFNRFFSPWLIMSRYLKPCLVFGRASVLLNCEEVTGSIEFVHMYGLKILELIDYSDPTRVIMCIYAKNVLSLWWSICITAL